MTRCCLCREPEGLPVVGNQLERTDLPGSGWRCRSHEACRQRVRDIVTAHAALAQIMEETR